jgi:hypothetical protein
MDFAISMRSSNQNRTPAALLPSNFMPNQILDSNDPSLYDVRSHARGPQGALPLTPEMLLHRPSGELFGLSQDAGMG